MRCMIVSFRDAWLRSFFVDDVRGKKIPAGLESQLFRRLQMLDDAMTDADLRAAIISRSCAARLPAGIRSASTSSGGSFSAGTAAGEKRPKSISTITAIGEAHMLMTQRKPASVGEILVEEFMEPLGLTQGDLAEAMGVPRKHVNELCNDRRAVTADTALMLARVFGNSAEFWLNVQRRNDLWDALHSPKRRERIERARPLRRTAA
jgi:antitoxin HigA-1